ncbi:MAG: phosphoglycerate dehydrogenase [Nitrospirae bacterium]|nr:phosphoglycerate dehydrogenase [Nitrospirota bacterium]
MKVLVSDSLSEKGVDIMKRSGLDVDVKTRLGPDELLKVIPDYDGLVVRSATKVTKKLIEAAKRLKVVGRAGSGLDNVDLLAATKRGIVVMNTPGGNTVTTAEHTVALIFSLARMIPQATASIKAGKWEKNKFMGMELYNKTLGIIGIGQIGSYVTKLAQGAQMQVIAYDPYLSEENAKKMGVELVDLNELYRRSDIISVHVPLTAETKSLINAEAIGKMKDGVRIINCARGGIVNEKDLHEALVKGKVAGTAIDVFEQEPVDPKNPLLALDNVICTPHIGAATTEAQENVALAIAEQIADYLIRGVVRGAVNIPSVPVDLLPKIQPYLTLAEKLGAFLAQSHEGGLVQLTIEYRGEVAALTTAPITVAALKGLLTPILEEPVNYVNAPIVARERGIEIKEIKSAEAGEFTSLVVLTVKAGSKQATVSGTLYNRKDPRIVEIDGLSLEVVPEGHMLLMINDDQPGVIGNIGHLLGDNRINISRMQLGRERSGGKAISVVGIDSPVSPELLGKLKKLPHVLSAKLIEL